MPPGEKKKRAKRPGKGSWRRNATGGGRGGKGEKLPPQFKMGEREKNREESFKPTNKKKRIGTPNQTIKRSEGTWLIVLPLISHIRPRGKKQPNTTIIKPESRGERRSQIPIFLSPF